MNQFINANSSLRQFHVILILPFQVIMYVKYICIYYTVTVLQYGVMQMHVTWALH